mgnify:CR=1 FL=1
MTINEPASGGEHQIIRELNLEVLHPGCIHKRLLHLVTDGMGMPLYVPVLIAKGQEKGPVVGITAAVHGNELNGIPVVQRLFKEIDVNNLRGTVIGVPVVNVPSLLRKRRRFIDGADLNHIFPGRPRGNVSEVYAHRIVNRIVSQFDYLIDLHTASFGRINSYYIRADLEQAAVRQMALLQNAQIIVHKPPSDGTLRGAADELQIPAVTLEVGDPNTFQKGMIRSGLTGIFNLLIHLGMIDGELEPPEQPPVMCDSSFWMYTHSGGILRVGPGLTDMVKSGEVIGRLFDIFGDQIHEYQAPREGIVIGKSTSPINQTGGRILHLGILQSS